MLVKLSVTVVDQISLAYLTNFCQDAIPDLSVNWSFENRDIFLGLFPHIQAVTTEST